MKIVKEASAHRAGAAWVTTALVALQAVLTGCAGMPGAAPPDYAAVVAAPDRSSADRETDKRRRPELLLAFTGVRPGMRVLDVNSGAGYTTELLARVLGPGGVVYAQDSQGIIDKIVRDRFDTRMKNAPVKNVVRVVREYEDPAPPDARNLDLVTFFFFYHDTVNLGVDRAKMNRALYNALKPGGILVVADHSARPGDGTGVTRTFHRIEESALRREIEAAGFQLIDEGRFLRHAEDPRDAPVFKSKVPVDEFVLKFRKPG
jgi:predicted methyltransferase